MCPIPQASPQRGHCSQHLFSRTGGRSDLARRIEPHHPLSLGSGFPVRTSPRVRVCERALHSGHAEGRAAVRVAFFQFGCGTCQLSFVFVALALVRSFQVLEVRWWRWAEALPGYVIGSLGAYWSIQRTFMLLWGLR